MSPDQIRKAEKKLQRFAQICAGTPIGPLAYEMWHCLLWCRGEAYGWDPVSNFEDRLRDYLTAPDSLPPLEEKPTKLKGK